MLGLLQPASDGRVGPSFRVFLGLFFSFFYPNPKRPFRCFEPAGCQAACGAMAACYPSWGGDKACWPAALSTYSPFSSASGEPAHRQPLTRVPPHAAHRGPQFLHDTECIESSFPALWFEDLPRIDPCYCSAGLRMERRRAGHHPGGRLPGRRQDLEHGAAAAHAAAARCVQGGRVG